MYIETFHPKNENLDVELAFNLVPEAPEVRGLVLTTEKTKKEFWSEGQRRLDKDAMY